MSNIYVQEPPTNGKVLLKTTVGDIEVELWSKEAPKACRNFVQLCMEGYYDGTIFHRLVKEFIVQGGDPDGDGGSVGESIYGKPFNDEFHSRIRFVRRGLVAMANSGKNDNTSHFFFTLGACPELNNKNTIFGRVGGDTIYNMLKLGEMDTDSNDRPLYPPKIKRTKIISNPFEDIVPRVSKKKEDDKEEKQVVKAKPVKNFNLLSFGDEAMEDEVEVIKATEKFPSKSSHDLLNDKNLSSTPAVVDNDDKVGGDDNDAIESDAGVTEEDEEISRANRKATMESIRDKLKRKGAASDDKKNKKLKTDAGDDDDDDDGEISWNRASTDRIKKYKNEAKELIREMRGEKKDSKSQEDEKKSKSFKLERNLDMFKGRQAGKKKESNNNDTASILSKFKNKIQTAKKLTEYDTDEGDNDGAVEDEDDEANPNEDLSWMPHKFVCQQEMSKVLDANIADLERYEIYDPRNPMTQRRKKDSSNKMKKQK